VRVVRTNGAAPEDGRSRAAAEAWAAGAADGFVVLGNAGELQQVVTNLLLNGCDAMAETGGELTVGLEALDGRALLTVADSGPGIPPDRLHKIFEPFFTTKLGRGTGLGLSISHEIVDRHDGTMRVESEPGQGARFTVELPLHRRG
jgi:signal transduction histidine kinase